MEDWVTSVSEYTDVTHHIAVKGGKLLKPPLLPGVISGDENEEVES